MTGVRTPSALLLSALLSGLCASASSAKYKVNLITERSLERTCFQSAAPWGAAYDIRCDVVMVYGSGKALLPRIEKWRQAGYVTHVMTGIAWGGYRDYLDGGFDGRKHWDEGQVDGSGRTINHGRISPYLVPTVSFCRYLSERLKPALDAGVPAIHLEEPEFWARAGFSESFKRAWRIFYNEPWRRPDSSCDARWRAGKLKYYLYRRALDQVCSALKEYALSVKGRPVRFYIPTHSLLNYTQWRIVSPESSLIDLPAVDGFVAQVWTGTARTPNIFEGKRAERTFETAYLEYGIMQELVRGTGKRMWFLHDPVEDNPRHDWDDYRRNYIATLTASLFHPAVCRYEVTPWPRRVFLGRFPAFRKDATRIPSPYATVLGVVFNQLRDMKQERILWEKSTPEIGIFLSDSAMFQRAEPAFSEGVAPDGTDPTRPTKTELLTLAGFYGLALPPLKHGIPVRPVQLENVVRFPGYLDKYRVLVLSYEFMKPLSPGVHLTLSLWVRRGGSLLYVGADKDPFNKVREWWNASGGKYLSPSEHLFECLGLARKPRQGAYKVGKGLVLVERKHPAFFSRSQANAKRLLALLRKAVEASGGRWIEKNHILLRRGPYVIAACLSESLSSEPLRLRGQFLNLLDPSLPVTKEVKVQPGAQAFLLDLEAVSNNPPSVLASAGRIEDWNPAQSGVAYKAKAPQGMKVATRILLPRAPEEMRVNGKVFSGYQWEPSSKTLFLEHPGQPEGTLVELSW